MPIAFLPLALLFSQPPGIHIVHYRNAAGAAEYDWIVPPYHDPSRIIQDYGSRSSCTLDRAGNLYVLRGNTVERTPPRAATSTPQAAATIAWTLLSPSCVQPPARSDTASARTISAPNSSSIPWSTTPCRSQASCRPAPPSSPAPLTTRATYTCSGTPTPLPSP